MWLPREVTLQAHRFARGGGIDNQCAPGRDKLVPLCDECMENWIAPTGILICQTCEGQEGPDMGLIMNIMGIAFISIFFIGSFCYMKSAAMIFTMMDENNNGYITEVEWMHACRNYEHIKEWQVSNKRLKYIYDAFHDGHPDGVRKFVFKAMWMHTLAEAHHSSQATHLKKRVLRVLKIANKRDRDKYSKSRRNAHMRAISEQNFASDAGATDAVEEEAEEAFGFSDSDEEDAELTQPSPDLHNIEAAHSIMSFPSLAEHMPAHLINPPHIPHMGSTIKLIFSWGQILSSFNVTFTVPWPRNFNLLMVALYAPFNLDVFYFFGNFKCQVNTNYKAAFDAHMRVPIILLIVVIISYFAALLLKKLLCCSCCQTMYDARTLRSRTLKLINLIVFIMYPGLGIRIFRVFATKNYGDYYYLIADLEIRTDSDEYKEMHTQAWIWMCVYVLAIPVAYFLMLLLNRKYIQMDPDDTHHFIPDEHHAKVIMARASYGAIYTSFRRKYYYFELVEMVRKITLVGALILLGEGGAGTQLFVGIIICFFYVFIGALFKPLAKKTDQILQYVTSIQLFSTLCTGLLLRNRMFERMQGIGDEKDDIVVDVVLTLTTFLVFVCIGFVLLYVLKDICCPKREKRPKKPLGGSKTKIAPEVDNDSKKEDQAREQEEFL